MNLEKVIELASFIYESEEIPKEGLKVSYTLPLDVQKNLDLELYKKMNNNAFGYKYNDIIEVNIGGILFTFNVEQ